MLVRNIFDLIPDDLPDEAFITLLNSDKVKIERIISKGHSSPKAGWYDQAQDEWVIVLKGEGIILFEDGESKHLKVGDFINIPRHKKHKVEWTLPGEETIWLAVHY